MNSIRLGEFSVVRNDLDSFCVDSDNGSDIARLFVNGLCGATARVGVRFDTDAPSSDSRCCDYDFVTRKSKGRDDKLVFMSGSLVRDKLEKPLYVISVQDDEYVVTLSRDGSNTELNFYFSIVSDCDDHKGIILQFRGSNALCESPFELFFNDVFSESWRRLLCAYVGGAVHLKSEVYDEYVYAYQWLPLCVTFRLHRGKHELVRRVLISDLGFVDVTGFVLADWIYGHDVVLDIHVDKSDHDDCGFTLRCLGNARKFLGAGEDVPRLRVTDTFEFNEARGGFDVRLWFDGNYDTPCGVCYPTVVYKRNIFSRLMVNFFGSEKSKFLRSLYRSW